MTLALALAATLAIPHPTAQAVPTGAIPPAEIGHLVSTPDECQVFGQVLEHFHWKNMQSRLQTAGPSWSPSYEVRCDWKTWGVTWPDAPCAIGGLEPRCFSFERPEFGAGGLVVTAISPTGPLTADSIRCVFTRRKVGWGLDECTSSPPPLPD